MPPYELWLQTRGRIGGITFLLDTARLLPLFGLPLFGLPPRLAA
jgi:hypothetical protein